MKTIKKALLTTVLTLSATVSMACEVTVGVVLELTGPAGAFGQAGAKSIEMAFRDINEAGGVIDGCMLVTDTRDSQSQGNVAVDQATQLVNIREVPVLIGGIISSVSVPIVTSVTAPAKVVQVSPASSSPTLTQLGREGITGGYFFRTITSDALQGVAAAKYARDSGLDNLAIIHVNNDFGVNLMREFTAAFEALGGNIKSTTAYNENQPSYASEVTAALGSTPDALYLISYPVDGATIARTWISQGGPQKYLFNDGLNTPDFIDAVGARFLEGAYGTSSGTTETPSTRYFYENYAEVSGGFEPSAPAADRSYDAGALVGLAIAKAGVAEADAIRAAIREVVDPEGEPIYAGPEEFGKALGLIAEGRAIKYEGVIGPVSFDEVGDISGPFRLWKIEDGGIVTTGQMTTEDVAETMSSLN
ncbi:ABC transporter substrate-binding protein [Roseobacter weihaiensis]|uniref:ABC transporter substrate-binding protein n=1 Tax=Roseobacter weihaiensis TaxID=2763262 RepID=UPI001D0A439C|nr:ABC transporter substrate-binding protein [Roseobacter sp. H9]